jgi:hypothetical protein
VNISYGNYSLSSWEKGRHFNIDLSSIPQVLRQLLEFSPELEASGGYFVHCKRMCSLSNFLAAHDI